MRAAERPRSCVLPTHLDNEVRPETVEAMMQATERNYDLARDYFRLKARLLGVRAPEEHGPLRAARRGRRARAVRRGRARSSSTPTAPSRRRSATSRATSSNGGWIDAEVRPGKRARGLLRVALPVRRTRGCCSPTPRRRATSRRSPTSSATACHDRLAARQRPLDYMPPLTLAETASVFGEMTADARAPRARAAPRRCGARSCARRSRTRSPRSSARTCSRASRWRRTPGARAAR